MKSLHVRLGGLALTAALLGCSTTTAAADFYLGASFGQTAMDDYEDYVTSNFDDGSFVSADIDDGDTGVRVFVGAEFTPNFGIEIGHVDLGEMSTDAVSNGCCFYAPGAVTHRLSADGLEVSAIGRLPLGESGGVDVRLGFLKWSGDERLADSTGSISGSDDGNDAFYAFGGEYRFGDRFGVRGEYAFYSLDDFDATFLSLSLIYYLGDN